MHDRLFTRETGRAPTWLTGMMLTALLAGCTSENVYDFLQDQGRQDCELQPIAQQKSCMEQYEMTYREYQRVRDQEGLTEKR